MSRNCLAELNKIYEQLEKDHERLEELDKRLGKYEKDGKGTAWYSGWEYSGDLEEYKKKVEDYNGKNTEYNQQITECLNSQHEQIRAYETKETAYIAGLSASVPAAAITGAGIVGGASLMWPYLKKFLSSIFKKV